MINRIAQFEIVAQREDAARQNFRGLRAHQQTRGLPIQQWRQNFRSYRLNARRNLHGECHHRALCRPEQIDKRFVQSQRRDRRARETNTDRANRPAWRCTAARRRLTDRHRQQMILGIANLLRPIVGETLASSFKHNGHIKTRLHNRVGTKLGRQIEAAGLQQAAGIIQPDQALGVDVFDWTILRSRIW
jgi:hypothetical protein